MQLLQGRQGRAEVPRRHLLLGRRDRRRVPGLELLALFDLLLFRRRLLGHRRGLLLLLFGCVDLGQQPSGRLGAPLHPVGLDHRPERGPGVGKPLLTRCLPGSGLDLLVGRLGLLEHLFARFAGAKLQRKRVELFAEPGINGQRVAETLLLDQHRGLGLGLGPGRVPGRGLRRLGGRRAGWRPLIFPRVGLRTGVAGSAGLPGTALVGFGDR